MNLFSLFHLLWSVGLASAYSCIDFNAPITVTAPSYIPAFTEFGNHYDAVSMLRRITTRPTGTEAPLFSGSTNATMTFSIDASFCFASDQPNRAQDIQVLSHGIGFDKSYWDFGGKDSEYNYVRAATNAGYATLSWSRPGTGASSSGNSYSILQSPFEAAVLIELTRLLRAGQLYAALPVPAGRVLHIGHSFGAGLSNVLISQAPHLSDGAVLTGYSHNSSWAPLFAVASTFHLAKEVDPQRWGDRSTGILTWPDELANQYVFFKQPNFDPNVLKQAEAIKQPFAVGEALTLFQPSLVAPQFTGPVLVSC